MLGDTLMDLNAGVKARDGLIQETNQVLLVARGMNIVPSTMPWSSDSQYITPKAHLNFFISSFNIELHAWLEHFVVVFSDLRLETVGLCRVGQ